jgi:putative transposase
MPNHVHLILVPLDTDGLGFAVGEAHRRYTRRVNFREGWRGHLWQERFQSFPPDETYRLAAARYIENNPVRAGLCAHPDDWLWSSARAHLSGEDDVLVRVAPILGWREYLDESLPDTIHAHTRTGRSLGSDAFLKAMSAFGVGPTGRLPVGAPPRRDRAKQSEPGGLART